MAYRDDDMTYAVEEYARTHPEGKLFWKAIVEWVHEKDTWENDMRLKNLVGIRDYQFYRKVKRKGKKGKSIETYRECRKRFDEINEARAYVAASKIPKLTSAAPEEFLVLPYSQQREAIMELQQAYIQTKKELGEATAKLQKGRIDDRYVDKIEQRVENVEIVIQRELKKSSKQINHIMRALNEREAREDMERKGITIDGIDRNKILDILENQSRELYSIKGDITKFRSLQKEKENNRKGENEPLKEDKKIVSWNDFNASLMDDDD